MSKRPITRSERGFQHWSGIRPLSSGALYRSSTFNFKRSLIALLVGLLFLQTTGLTFGQGSSSPTAQSPAAASQQELSGTLYAIVGDPAPGTRAPSRYSYWLLGDNNQAYDLSFGAAFLQANPGLQNLIEQHVKVSGALDTNAKTQTAGQSSKVAFQVTNLVATNGAAARLRPHPTGTQPFISIMCKFQDNTAEPQNRDYFVNQLIGANNPLSFDKYFREMSFNTLNLQGSDAQGWFTLPSPRSTYITGTPEKADLNKMAHDCSAVAQAANVNFASYYGINFMFNGLLDGFTAWGGRTNLNLTGQQKSWPATWMGYVVSDPGSSFGTGPTFGWNAMSILAHEMNHAFGAAHSNDANGYEYGSAWDVTSKPGWNCRVNGSNTQFYDPTYGCIAQGIIAYSRSKMGFLTGSQIVNYDGSQGTATFTLERLGQPTTTTDPLMIKVPIGQDPNRYYTVEARYRVGFDSKLPVDGVIIHGIDESGKTYKSGNPAQIIIPPNAPNVGDNGAAWLPGMTFNDTANNVAITVQSATTTGFVVVVNAPQAINLIVTQTDSGAPSAANIYSTTFTTTVTAQGANTAKNVVVKPNFFIGTYYIPLTANVSQGTYNPNIQKSDWAVGDMPPGTTATMSVTYRTPPPANPGAVTNAQKPGGLGSTGTTGVVASVAVATASNSIPNKQNTKNYAVSGDTPTSDIDLYALVSNEDPYVGDVVTFTLSTINLGPTNATNISITNQLQAGLSFVSASASAGNYNSSTGLWTIPSLNDGDEVVLNIAARVTQAQALTLTTTKLGQDQFDPNSLNDGDFATTYAQNYIPDPFYESSPVDPTIYHVDEEQSSTLTPSGGEINFNNTAVGSPVTFALTIANSGTGPLVVSNPTLEGNNASDFSLSMPVSVTIAPKQTYNVNLVCNPNYVGTRDTYLVFNTNDTTLNQAQYHLVCNGSYNTFIPTYIYNLPFVANNANGFTTYLAIQNVATSTASVQAVFRDTAGNSYNVLSAACSNLAAYAVCNPTNPLANGSKGIGQILSNQPLAIIVAEGTPFGSSAYSVSAGASSSLIAPLAINNSGGFSTQLTVANDGATSATVTIKFYDKNGNLAAGATKNLVIAPFSAQTLDQTEANSGLNSGFYGWALINGAAGSQLTAQVLEQRPDIKFLALANAQPMTQNTPANYTLYAPAIFKGAFGGFNTGSNIVNPNANPVTTTITYYSNTGTAITTTPFVIPAYGVAAIFQGSQGGTNGLPQGAGLPNSFYGSATVTTQGGSVAMVVNEANGITANGAAQSGTYSAATTGSSILGLPAVANNANGFISGATILNTSNSTVSGTITYYNTNGTVVGSPQGFTVGPNASFPAYQGAANLPTGFGGQAVITQTGGTPNSLIATTNVQSPNLFYTYTQSGQ